MGAVVAAGVTAVSALPAHAAVSCQVTYQKTWDSGSGFGGRLTLNNTGDPLTSWTITFAFPNNQQIVPSPWNVGSWSQSGQNVTLNNAAWNGSVPTGGTVSDIGFNGTYSGTNNNPTAFSVNGVACGGTQQTPQLVVTPTSVSVPEGGTASYTVRLTAAFPSPVVVNSVAAGTGDTNITVSAGGSQTIPANSTGSITVTLAAAEDADTLNGSRTITVSSTTAGINPVTVTATEQDNDTATQSLVVTPTALNVPEGASATYNVRPNVALSGSATITVTSTLSGTGDTSITLQGGSPQTLTLNAANSASGVNVTVLAAEDTDTTNGTRTITVSAPNLASVTVTATEQDNDQASQMIVVTGSPVTVPEQGTAQYSVSLATDPGAAGLTVTSTLGTGDADITIASGATLTFTSANFAIAQPVTLAAADDADTTNGTRTITVSATGAPSVTVTANEQDNDGATNVYLAEFMTQYNKIKASASGYFSPEGVPYHSVERLMVEAPDHGHETTSEAYSFFVWLEAAYGRETGDWSRFNAAWTNLETFIIPNSGFQTMNYNPTDPADYAPEFPQPSQYPAPLDSNIDTGNDPLYQELVSTYGNSAIYAMHWLLDVDNVYGYGQAVSSVANCRDSTPRVVFINTYQRGPQESVWETVAHPSCETFAWGAQNNGGFAPIFIGGTAAQQWRFTDAPDADARAIEAAYWALTWATAQGNQSQVTTTVGKAAKMGDYLRYAFYDKYFKNPGCASPSCPTSSGKSGATGLLAWYFAWGGAMDNAWSWRIGASHNHGGYQNPLAAWAMSAAGPTAIRPMSPTAAADWAFSLTRQIQFITWLQSAEGAIAGGATNSWNGNYSARPAGQPQFFGMTYDVQPVYHDPPSNQWFGFQAWGMSRVAEYYNVTGNADAKAILDKWVAWAIANTTLGTGNNYQIPSTLSWSGAPAADFSSATGMPGTNPNLHVSIVDFTNDVGPTAALARTLTSYAARAGATSGLGLQAKNTAKGLLDRLLLRKDSIGIAVAEQRTDYNRFDDVWTSTNQQGLFIPNGYSGVMPNGNTIQPGSTFLSIRTFLQNEPGWASVQTYLGGGAAPTFTYHRFWAQADIALALADFGHAFPNG